MISIENRAAFANAEKKAGQVKPVVSMIEFGTYIVWGASTNYTVQFCKDNAGHFAATCTCPAHTKSSTPKACYHICGAYIAHKIQVNVRRQVRAYEAPSITNWIVETTKEAA
jgi:hypothetical protein